MQPVVGRYRILRPLGRGAMGLVYLAEDPSLNRQVAIKMLDIAADSQTDRDFLRNRLLRDARAAAILSHPNIVAVYDIVEEGDAVYVVMEYIEGETLASILDNTPAPGNAFIVDVLRQMAAALDYTHSRGIIHRDIKPGNVMVSAGGRTKILDFGIARMSDVRTSTPTGIVMGTVDYMAPEQIKGEAVDGRADQFALAAVAYRMMTGSTLFGRHNLATLAYKLVNEHPPSICVHNTAIPAAVDPVFSRALAKLPASRYPTCSDFVENLSRALAGPANQPIPLMSASGETTIHSPAPASALGPPARKASHFAAMAAGGALLLAAGGAIAIWKPFSTQVKPPAAVSPISNEAPAANPQAPAQKQFPAAATADKPVPLQPQKFANTVPPSAPPPAPVLAPPQPTQDAFPRAAAVDARDTPFRRGLDEIRGGDYPGAIRSFSNVIDRRPKLPMAFYNRGFAYQMSGEFEKAVSDYSDALRLGARDARTFTNRGISAVRLHQDDTALVDFNHALEIDPAYAGALNGRGGVFYRRRQYQAAIREFSAAIKSNPGFLQAYENRAAAEKASGNVSGAAADRAVVERLRRGK